jgi:hypothetical protein
MSYDEYVNKGLLYAMTKAVEDDRPEIAKQLLTTYLINAMERKVKEKTKWQNTKQH